MFDEAGLAVGRFALDANSHTLVRHIVAGRVRSCGRPGAAGLDVWLFEVEPASMGLDSM